MKCRNDCPGEDKDQKILHTERHGEETVFIDDVPVLVCQVCGDTLLSLETVRHIERLLNLEQPAKRLPGSGFSQEPVVQ